MTEIQLTIQFSERVYVKEVVQKIKDALSEEKALQKISVNRVENCSMRGECHFCNEK